MSLFSRWMFLFYFYFCHSRLWRSTGLLPITQQSVEELNLFITWCPRSAPVIGCIRFWSAYMPNSRCLVVRYEAVYDYCVAAYYGTEATAYFIWRVKEKGVFIDWRWCLKLFWPRQSSNASDQLLVSRTLLVHFSLWCFCVNRLLVFQIVHKMDLYIFFFSAKRHIAPYCRDAL